jgi:uncharacterized protein YggE
MDDERRDHSVGDEEEGHGPDHEVRAASASPGAARGRPPRRSGRTAALAVTISVLLLAVAGAGLGLALSDAGASTLVSPAAGCGGSSPHLTVQGTGESSAPPDVLTAVFGFSSSAGSSAAALSANNAKVNQALLALEGNGVHQADIATTGLSLQAQYAYPKGVPTLTGYQATNTVTATLRNTKTAGTAIDDVVTASGDAAQINSLSFSFSDPAKVEDQARAKAVHQAVAHAGAMAAAAGRRLGPVCALTDNTQPSQVEPSLGFAANASGALQGSPVPVEPGSQQESDQVTMVYALEQR